MSSELATLIVRLKAAGDRDVWKALKRIGAALEILGVKAEKFGKKGRRSQRTVQNAAKVAATAIKDHWGKVFEFVTAETKKTQQRQIAAQKKVVAAAEAAAKKRIALEKQVARETRIELEANLAERNKLIAEENRQEQFERSKNLDQKLDAEKQVARKIRIEREANLAEKKRSIAKASRQEQFERDKNLKQKLAAEKKVAREIRIEREADLAEKKTSFFPSLRMIGKIIAAYWLLKRAIRAVITAIKSIITAHAKLEEGFLRVERMDPAMNMRKFEAATITAAKAIKHIDISELQAAEQVVARMGLRGSEQIVKFSTAVSQLADIVSGDAAQIANDMGKILGIWDVKDQVRGVEQLSDVFLMLESSFKVTVPEMTNIMQRLSGLAKQAGMSAHEVAALSAAMKDIGGRTEVSAGAAARLFEGVLGNVHAIGKLLGKTGIDLDKFIQGFEDDAYKAFVGFLKDLPPEFMKTKEAFELMEITGVRYMPFIRTMADEHQVFADALEVSTAALEENAGATQKASELLDTGLTAAVKDLKESWTLFLASLGESDVWLSVIRNVTHLIDELTELAEWLGMLDSSSDWFNESTGEPWKNSDRHKKQSIDPNAPDPNAPLVRGPDGWRYDPAFRYFGTQGEVGFKHQEMAAIKAAAAEKGNLSPLQKEENIKRTDELRKKQTEGLAIQEQKATEIINEANRLWAEAVKAKTVSARIGYLERIKEIENIVATPGEVGLDKAMLKTRGTTRRGILKRTHDEITKIQRKEEADKLAKEKTTKLNRNRETFHRFFISQKFDDKRRIAQEKIDSLRGGGIGGTFSGKSFAKRLIARETERRENQKIKLLEDISRNTKRAIDLQEQIERHKPEQSIVDEIRRTGAVAGP